MTLARPVMLAACAALVFSMVGSAAARSVDVSVLDGAVRARVSPLEGALLDVRAAPVPLLAARGPSAAPAPATPPVLPLLPALPPLRIQDATTAALGIVNSMDDAIPVDVRAARDAPSAPSAHAATAAPAPACIEAQGARAAASVPAPVAAVGLAVTAAAAIGWAVGAWTLAASQAKRALGLLGVAGFTRLNRADVLGHDAREGMYALIRDQPGRTIVDLMAASSVSRNTATYHLRVLEREGLIASVREGRRRLFFPTGVAASGRPESAAFAAIAHETTRSVARSVIESPGMDQRTLCAKLALPASLAHWHVDRLENAGLVTRVRDGRHVRYYPGPAAARVPL